MTTQRDSRFLRRLLLTDALISGASGLLMFFGASALETVLAVPAGLFRWAGISLIPFTAALLVLARNEPLPRSGVWAVIGANAAWVIASVLLLVSGEIAPNWLGSAFILVQAVAVAVLAEMQYVGLRRAHATAQ